MARLRRSINRKLETYVYRKEAKGHTYYFYEHPIAKAKGVPRKYFGDDWKAANEFAKKVNPQLSPLKDEIADYVDTVQPEIPAVVANDPRQKQKADKLNATMREVIKRFKAESDQCKKWQASTIWEDAGGHLRDFADKEGDVIFSQLDAPMCGEIFNAHRKRSGVYKMRSTLSGVMKWAINKGYHTKNVALDYTPEDGEKHTERKRERMLSEGFVQLQEKAIELGYEWLADAMVIALATAQGRAEVVSWTFRDNLVKIDGEEYLRFERQKTRNKDGGSWQEIKVEGTLKDVLHRCRVRALKMGCPFIVTVTTGRLLKQGKKHRCQCLPNFLSDKLDWISEQVDNLKGGKHFHEIRSLACRIYYELHGFDFVRDLTNHETAEQTKEYLKGDQRVYQKGIANLPFEMIKDLKIVN